MCGIYGVSGANNAVDQIIRGLFCLQHRGHESAGFAVWNNQMNHIKTQKRVGFVSHLREKIDSAQFPGETGIGHVRYGTIGGTGLRNAQPLVKEIFGSQMAIAHNGDLVRGYLNGDWLSIGELREELQRQGVVFDTTADTELIFSLIARSDKIDVIDKILDTLNRIAGAFSLLILWNGFLIATKDPWGFRPLCFGKANSSYTFASENCAFSHTGVEFVKNLAPGEVIIVTPDGEINTYQLNQKGVISPCSFEFVYLSRPDSNIFDVSVSSARKALGRATALEMNHYNLLPLDALVIPVLDSGRTTALSFAQILNHLRLLDNLNKQTIENAIDGEFPFDFGLNRNQYSARNFITPGQKAREADVDLKHNPDSAIVAGRKIIKVDDSIVRATTATRHVALLRKAGATEVHVAIASPRIVDVCHYGVDIKHPEELIAANHSLEETKQIIGADSLYHLSLLGYQQALREVGLKSFCDACFSRNYPLAPF